MQQSVPVVDVNQIPLMPTTRARADRWIKSGKATGFWKRGIFCVRLNQEPSARNYQPVACGIDPGSRMEAYTIASAKHQYINIQAKAVDWVKKHIKTRREMRRNRRYHKTPCRQPRWNRLANKIRLAPSTKSRWQWKLRLANWLSKIYPITIFVVEDIKARSWGGKWGKTFSPLQVGKEWFYHELEKLAPVELLQGHETAELRNQLGLKKKKNKMATVFSAHCVDSFTLAYSAVGGETNPSNRDLLVVTPLRFHRRQLHRLEHAPGHIRSNYGGTISAGFKRGSIVKHPKWGLTYVGGEMVRRPRATCGRKGTRLTRRVKPTKFEPNRKVISLHSIETGKRLTQSANPKDIKFLTYNTWRSNTVPA
ncbi:MAG: RRXRR domain-containing protein [Xenococcaceae cyanobacterium MO_207.B15]|nr:RRXRR domain-containing protein [Xenococcaceae cyanobacterium MO_207.B15]